MFLNNGLLLSLLLYEASSRETSAKTLRASHGGETVLSRARCISIASVAHHWHVFFFYLALVEHMFASVFRSEIAIHAIMKELISYKKAFLTCMLYTGPGFPKT